MKKKKLKKIIKKLERKISNTCNCAQSGRYTHTGVLKSLFQSDRMNVFGHYNSYANEECYFS